MFSCEADVICLRCWSKEEICCDAKWFRCLKCAETLQAESLSEHCTHQHESDATVFMTCFNKPALPENTDGYKIGSTIVLKDNGADATHFQCNECSFTSCVLSTFRMHLVSQHQVKAPTTNYTPRCASCGSFFTLNRVKTEHEFLCSGNSFPFCEFCGDRFSLPSKLLRHKKSCAKKRKQTKPGKVKTSAKTFQSNTLFVQDTDLSQNEVVVAEGSKRRRNLEKIDVKNYKKIFIRFYSVYRYSCHKFMVISCLE